MAIVRLFESRTMACKQCGGHPTVESIDDDRYRLACSCGMTFDLGTSGKFITDVVTPLGSAGFSDATHFPLAPRCEVCGQREGASHVCEPHWQNWEDRPDLVAVEREVLGFWLRAPVTFESGRRWVYPKHAIIAQAMDLLGVEGLQSGDALVRLKDILRASDDLAWIGGMEYLASLLEAGL